MDTALTLLCMVPCDGRFLLGGLREPIICLAAVYDLRSFSLIVTLGYFFILAKVYNTTLVEHLRDVIE